MVDLDLEITIDGKQVWPSTISPKLIAFQSRIDDEGFLIYTVNAIDDKGGPRGRPIVMLKMHPREAQSIHLAVKRASERETLNMDKAEAERMRKTAETASRNVSRMREESGSDKR